MRTLSSIRANVLPETAMVIAVILMLLYGSMQIALYGFGQVSADGAAFVAANAVANSTKTSPIALAASLFPGISQSNISTNTSQKNVVISQASTTMPGLPFVPGMPASLPINGADIEPYSANSKTPMSFAFAAAGNLNNYCPYQNNCVFPTTYAVHLAQNLDYSGQGKNGVFEEWYCHVNTYATVSFPAQRPAPGPQWDPSNPASGAEYAIYQWDGGASC
ncbi:MAG: hypothetical protein ABR584_12685 [Candidatus Baltobacteraceae bacterium]